MKLQFITITDLTEESLVLLDMVSSSGGDPGASFEKMSMVLKMIKDFVQTDNPYLDETKIIDSEVTRQRSGYANPA